MTTTTRAPGTFTSLDTSAGVFSLRAVELPSDAALLHSWVTAPHASYWGMSAASITDVAKMYEQEPQLCPFIGVRAGVPLFLLEHYEPSSSELAKHYDCQPFDVGMHILMAPHDIPEPGLTNAVFGAVLTWLFALPGTERVVVEPDVRNSKVRAKNILAGFTEHQVVNLPDKSAMLSTCTHESFTQSIISQRIDIQSVCPERSSHVS